MPENCPTNPGESYVSARKEIMSEEIITPEAPAVPEVVVSTLTAGDVYGQVMTVDWNDVDAVKAVAIVAHRWMVLADTIRTTFDKNVWAGWATGKFTAEQVPSIREQRKSDDSKKSAPTLDDLAKGKSKI